MPGLWLLLVAGTVTALHLAIEERPQLEEPHTARILLRGPHTARRSSRSLEDNYIYEEYEDPSSMNTCHSVLTADKFDPKMCLCFNDVAADTTTSMMLLQIGTGESAVGKIPVGEKATKVEEVFRANPTPVNCRKLITASLICQLHLCERANNLHSHKLTSMFRELAHSAEDHPSMEAALLPLTIKDQTKELKATNYKYYEHTDSSSTVSACQAVLNTAGPDQVGPEMCPCFNDVGWSGIMPELLRIAQQNPEENNQQAPVLTLPDKLQTTKVEEAFWKAPTPLTARKLLTAFILCV